MRSQRKIDYRTSLCMSLETSRRAKQRYSKTHVGATHGKSSIEAQRKEPRERGSERDNAKQNKNNNAGLTVGQRAKQKQRAKLHRTKSVATHRVMEATAGAPEEARARPRTPPQTVASRTPKIFSLRVTEQPQRRRMRHRYHTVRCSGHQSPTSQ